MPHPPHTKQSKGHTRPSPTSPAQPTPSQIQPAKSSQPSPHHTSLSTATPSQATPIQATPSQGRTSPTCAKPRQSSQARTTPRHAQLRQHQHNLRQSKPSQAKATPRASKLILHHATPSQNRFAQHQRPPHAKPRPLSSPILPSTSTKPARYLHPLSTPPSKRTAGDGLGQHSSGVFSGCPNQEIGWPFLFHDSMTGTCSYWGPLWVAFLWASYFLMWRATQEDTGVGGVADV
jgi:hypothetical protein